MGILIRHISQYKDPYKPTSIRESRMVFSRSSHEASLFFKAWVFPNLSLSMMYLRVGIIYPLLGIYPLYPRGSNHYFKLTTKGRGILDPMRLRNHDVLLRMLHRFDLLVPSRASGQRHVVPCFRWSRRGGWWWSCRWRWEWKLNPLPPPEDSRKKDQPLDKGTMKNPRRKNLFFAAPTARHLQILAGPRNNLHLK